MSRKYLIAGNWKMNKNSSEAKALVEEVVQTLGSQTDVNVVVCPPFTSLETAAATIGDSNIQLGAQNMSQEASGAFTGEISAEMLRHLYVKSVILGHSERRALYGETDEIVNTKVLAALENSLKPILCVGETLEEREAGTTMDVVKTQLHGGLKSVSSDSMDNVVIAYEPVWAIGTGKTATPEMAQEVHGFIRAELVSAYGEEAANKVRILYGGSMKPENAGELLAQADIDGGLIGGASLVARSFCAIAESAIELTK